MPKRRRRLPGQYMPKPEIDYRNFTGPGPLELFQGPDGRWGAKDAEGKIEIEPIYRKLAQTPEEMASDTVRLASRDSVLLVSPNDWDVIAWISSDFPSY